MNIMHKTTVISVQYVHSTYDVQLNQLIMLTFLENIEDFFKALVIPFCTSDATIPKLHQFLDDLCSSRLYDSP